MASAGVTHVPPAWLGALQRGGCMMLPLTAANGWRFLMLLTKGAGTVHPIQSLGPCGFYPCLCARHDDEAEALSRAPEPELTAAYRTDPPPDDRTKAWAIGRNHWIARR